MKYVAEQIFDEDKRTEQSKSIKNYQRNDKIVIYSKDSNMTNTITEVQVNVDFFIKEYYNKNNKKLTNKYKYIIMLGLTLEELKEFNERYGDEVMEECVEAMEKVVNDEEIEPLFTREEEKELEVNTARLDGIEIGEKRGIAKGRNDEKLELASKMVKEHIPLEIR